MTTQDNDTQIICDKAIALEMVLKDVNISSAFQIHKDYTECIETNCQGINQNCDYYNSYVLNRKLTK